MAEVREPKEVFQLLFNTEEYKKLIEEAKRSLIIDYKDIVDISPRIANKILEDYDSTSNFGIETLKRINPTTEIRNIRYKNIPLKSLKDVKDSDRVGELVTTQGIIGIIGEVTPRPWKINYVCSCLGYEVEVVQDNPDELSYPGECPECGKVGDYTPLNTKYLNKQWVKIQEPTEEIKQGTQPVQLKLLLEDDLVEEAIQPGDLVKVTGIVSVMEKGTKRNKSYYFYIKANNLEVEDKRYEDMDITPEEEEAIKELSEDPELEDKISKSIAPRIAGMGEVKKAIALQLFGGVPEEEEDGVWVRGDIHILLVGDPGIGKSHIFKHISKNLAPRGIYTTGRGSSGVGLTASVRQDKEYSGEYILEAGAMVLGDKGLVCIDEFDKMNPEERRMIHEPLEQQTVSIAKAGIVSTLNSRCTVLAGANPKGNRVDRDKNIKDLINLPSTIIDRFDLLFLLEDVPKTEEDKEKAKVILSKMERGKRFKEGIPPELLKKYISYARGRYDPDLSTEAIEKGIEYYNKSREGVDKQEDPIPITPRFLHGIKRLSQARARMYLREEVTLEDMEEGIKIVESYLETVGMDPLTGKVDIDKVEGRTPSSEKELRKLVRMVIADYKEGEGEGFRWYTSKSIKKEAITTIIEEAKRKGLRVDVKRAEKELDKVIEWMTGDVEDLE